MVAQETEAARSGYANEVLLRDQVAVKCTALGHALARSQHIVGRRGASCHCRAGFMLI